MIVHHQTIVVATVRRKTPEIDCDNLRTFLSGLTESIAMQRLFDPIAIHGKFGFTGIVGIVTSHIAFHYFDADQTLHLDVYSCKPYDLKRLIEYTDAYWQIEHADVLFIRRDEGPSIERFSYTEKLLQKVDHHE
jgi:S-adenosylmethionine/arginine decarboxylase-like enzyme